MPCRGSTWREPAANSRSGSSSWVRPVRALKAKIRALTHKRSQQDLAYVLTRLGQIMRGWAMYFRHAVAKHTFSKLDTFRSEDPCPDTQDIAAGPRVRSDPAGPDHARVGHVFQARRGQAHLQQTGHLQIGRSVP